MGREQSYSFEFEDYRGNAVTQTGKTYFDDDWNWVGDIFDDGTFSGSRFELKLDGGGRREVGSEGDNNFSRSFDFTFDVMTNLLAVPKSWMEQPRLMVQIGQLKAVRLTLQT